VLETAQTALTGADIYYWFVDGFGDAARLERSHFSSIDSPVMRAVISLVVQGYFCYRIWVLNKRSSWICWTIAVVCIPDPPRILPAPDVFLNTECGDSSSRRDVDRHHSQSYTHSYRTILSYTAFSRSCLGSMWFPRQLYMYAHSFRSKWPYHLIHCLDSYGRYRVPWRTF